MRNIAGKQICSWAVSECVQPGNGSHRASRRFIFPVKICEGGVCTHELRFRGGGSRKRQPVFPYPECGGTAAGCCELESGEYEITIYTCCCNADKGIYYYTSYDNHQITAVEMHRENLDSRELIWFPLMKEEQIRRFSKFH